jgi:hypothetical protein
MDGTSLVVMVNTPEVMPIVIVEVALVNQLPLESKRM